MIVDSLAGCDVPFEKRDGGATRSQLPCELRPGDANLLFLRRIRVEGD